MVGIALLDSARKNEIKRSVGYVAEYSMNEYDYSRYHNLLSLADGLRIDIISKRDPSLILQYYAVLDTLYSNWFPLIKDKPGFEKELFSIKELVEKWKNELKNSSNIKFPVTLAEKLLDFHRALLIEKQAIGLGIRVTKLASEKIKFLRAGDIIEE